MQEQIEIEKSIDSGELRRAGKLFRKIRILDYLSGVFKGSLVVIILASPLIYPIFISYIQTIESIKGLSYFILVSFLFYLPVICLLFLIWWKPRYEYKITDVNLLSSYFLVGIISKIKDYIEKPYNNEKVIIRKCNFFINYLKFLFSDINLSNLKNLSFVAKDIGNEKLDCLSALDKEIPEIYGGSNTEQITGVLNGFRQLLSFLKTNDIQSLARSLAIFKKYRMEVEEKIQNQKIWRRKIEKVKKFYANRSQTSKKVIKSSFALLASFIIVIGLAFLLAFLLNDLIDSGVLIVAIIACFGIIYTIFFREPGGETFKESR
jgi:hypothetical protein